MRPAARALGIGYLLIGATTVASAGPIATAVAGTGGRPDPRIVRVLGARQCVQGLLTIAVPTSDVLWLGAAVDTAHAASMAPLLVTRFRRAALISASVAGVSALVAGLVGSG